MTGPTHADIPNATILCIEDEDELRRDVADELVEAGYRVMEARNGQEALAGLERRLPDLVLCDISMPGIDGYGVLEAMRQRSAAFAEVPFIFLTALADPRQVVEGKRLGADDYLVKPIDYDLLLATVEARLRQIGRIRASREEAACEPVAASFDLTPAEIRVATAMLQGKTRVQIAAKLGIASTTVAFHIRNIFQKTGTNRQAELVALLLKGRL